MSKRYLSAEEKRSLYRSKLRAHSKVFGPETLYSFIPNNMAAGPCSHCLDAAKQTYLLDDLPIAPLEGCPHPDQCVAYYPTNLELDDFDDNDTYELPPGIGLG